MTLPVRWDIWRRLTRMMRVFFAQMAAVINYHPERDRFIRTLPDAERQVLNAIVVCRHQLIAMPVTEQNRLYTAHPQSKKNINIIKALEDEHPHPEPF